MGILILLISGISNSGPDTHFLLSYYSINISVFFLNKLVTLYFMCVPFNREKKEKKKHWDSNSSCATVRVKVFIKNAMLCLYGCDVGQRLQLNVDEIYYRNYLIRH